MGLKKELMPSRKLSIQDTVFKKEREIRLFFLIFYLVGIAGILLPQSRQLFLNLIPLALILSFVGLLLFHKGEKQKTTILLFFGMYTLAFIIEAMGTNLNIIFGSYNYGYGLGTQVWNTPLLIGVNWIFLVYASASLVSNFRLHPVLHILAASLLMVIYDLVLEQVAPRMNMWFWADNSVPIQNYVAWLVIAIFFHSIVKIVGLSWQNKIAPIILLYQFLFFLILSMFLSW